MKIGRVLFIMMILIFAFSFVFCGDDTGDNEEKSQQEEKTGKPKEKELDPESKKIIESATNKDDRKLRMSKADIKLATTTSTENSGLLDYMLPEFENRTDIGVDVIAVGTGAALNLGRNGDVDVVMVHAKEAEMEFVEEGFGVNREDIMYNDFVILGPVDDPAGIQGQGKAVEAFKTIAGKEATFISRGDDSGTHKKEKQIWEKAGIEPSGDWYQEAGRGMGDVITMADQQQAYTLADRGTFLSMMDKISITILHHNDEMLFNPYGIIAVNPEKYPHVKYEEAMSLIEWFISEEAENLIKSYTVKGQQLFHTYE
jgi:tungstate transport system substrate-binding protein